MFYFSKDIVMQFISFFKKANKSNCNYMAFCFYNQFYNVFEISLVIIINPMSVMYKSYKIKKILFVILIQMVRI